VVGVAGAAGQLRELEVAAARCAPTSRDAPTTGHDSGFVECSVQDLLGAGAAPDSGTVLELTSSTGTRLVVRLAPHDRLDLAALARSLWSAGG
jgi:hypothetical protein